MVHRPADSRLLSNLLSHEKDYARALHSQLDFGQASLSSLSAYAAASPPPASRAIVSVTDALIGAHDALRGYIFAIEEWCEQLKMLKEMEDEVGNIARDREILVDRLIKASKSNNPKRRSILPTSTSGNSSLLSSASQSSSYLKGHSLEHLAFSNSKLNLAQNELHACETHLSEKERILVQMREGAIIGGLKSRCKALAECGTRWEELGRMGLGALDPYDPALLAPSGHAYATPNQQKPLPDPTRPSSDLSSIAPSQSASQICNTNAQGTSNVSASMNSGSTNLSRGPVNGTKSVSSYTPYLYSPPGTATSGMTRPEADINDIHASQFTLDIKPAHAISEEDHWTPPQAQSRHSFPSRRDIASPTTENEDEELGGSSDTDDAEDGRVLEVHDNPNPLIAQFSKASKLPDAKKNSTKTGSHLSPLKRRKSPTQVDGLTTSVSSPFPLSSSTYPVSENKFGSVSSSNEDSPRPRKRSTFLGLGALKGLFHRDRGPSQSNSVVDHSNNTMSPVSPASRGGYSPSSASLPAPAPFANFKGKNYTSNVNLASYDRPSPSTKHNGGSGWNTRTDMNLKRADRADSSDEEPVRTRSEGPNYGALARKSKVERKALPTPGDSSAKLRKSSDGVSQRRASLGSNPRQRTISASGVNVSKNGNPSPIPSIITSQTSNVSTSVSGPSSDAKAGVKKGLKKPRPVSVDSSFSRNTSISSSVSAPVGVGSETTAHRRSGSFSDTGSRATGGRGQIQASLLSIVEGVTLENRQAWASVNPDPSKTLFEVKAPQSVCKSQTHDLSDKNEDEKFDDSDLLAARNARMAKRSTIHNTSPSPRSSQAPSRQSTETQWHRLSTISASSSSEPHLPLKSPPVPQSMAPKVPLRSALRNRTPSPNPPIVSPASTSRPSSPPISEEPVQSTTNNKLSLPTHYTHPPFSTDSHTNSSPQPSSSSHQDNQESQPKGKEDDTASLSSAYETGHEELSSDNDVESDGNDTTITHSDEGRHAESGPGSTVGGGSTVGSDGPPTPTPLAKFSINHSNIKTSHHIDIAPGNFSSQGGTRSTTGIAVITNGRLVPDGLPKTNTIESLAQHNDGNMANSGQTMMVPSSSGGRNGSVPGPASVSGSASGSALGSVEGAGSTTVTGDSPPVRRKSVRVMSKPTFAPTPPALAESEDSEGTGAYEPWSRGSGRTHDLGKDTSSRIPDAWEDSSEEDEEYSRARQMLLKLRKKI